MKITKIAKYSLLATLAFASVGLISGCKKDDEKIQKTEQEGIYDLYVQYMSAKGETPLKYEDWLSTIKGDKGDKGDNGKDGISPKVRINDETKCWEISVDDGKNWVSTEVRATPEVDYQRLEELLQIYAKITLEDLNGALNNATDMDMDKANTVAIIPFNHVNGPKAEWKFYAVVNFQYKANRYVKYQVTYLSDTSRASEFVYWSTAYIEMTLPESGNANDIVLKKLSYDNDGDEYYNAGVWGDSPIIYDYEGTNIIATYEKMEKPGDGEEYYPSFKEDYIPLLIGKTKAEIDQWDYIDDMKNDGAMSQEMFDDFTGASVSANNILRILHAVFKYHADTFLDK